MALIPRRRPHADTVDELTELSRPPGSAPGLRFRTLSYNGNNVAPFVIGDEYKYEVHEGLPELPSTHPRFIEAEQLAHSIVNRVTGIFPQWDIPDRELATLVKDLDKLQKVDYPSPVRVGLVGDLGAGKSSCINALLGHPLASAGDSGFSCTQVVTEFVASDSSMVGYSATIKFKDRATIDRDVKKQFLTYAKYRPRNDDHDGPPANPTEPDKIDKLAIELGYESNDEDDVGGGGNDDEEVDNLTAFARTMKMEVHDNANGQDLPETVEDDDDEEKEVQRELFKTAEEFLMQLFAPSLRLQGPGELEEVIATCPPHTYGRKIKISQRQLRSIMDKTFSGGILSMRAGEASIHDGCLGRLVEKLRCFTDIQPFGIQSWWPLLERATVSLSSALLSQGIILADLPGLADGNLARRRATTSYLERCGAILVLATVDRILDAASVSRALDLYIPQVGISRTVLVPTKCEMIDHNPMSNAILPEESQRLATLQNNTQDLRQKWRSTSGPEKRSIRQDLRHAERMLRRTRIQVRNQTIIGEAQRRYRQKHNGIKHLTVVPISCLNHERWMAGEFEDGEPVLYPHEDGVSQLRGILTRIAREKRVSALQKHIRIAIPMALRRLQLSLILPLNQRIDQVFAVINQYIDASTTNIQNHRYAIASPTNELVLEPIEQLLTSRDGTLARKISALVREWKVYYNHWKTLEAFARKNGVHKPSKSPEVLDLNQDIVAIFKQDLADRVADLRPRLRDERRQIICHLKEELKKLRVELEPISMLKNFDLKPFWQNFDLLPTNFDLEVHIQMDQYVNKIHEAVMHAVSGDQRTFFNKAMQKAYYTAHLACIHYTPVMGHRYDRLRSELRSSTGPLAELVKELKETTAKVLNEQTQTAVTMLQSPFLNVKKDLEVAFGKGRDVTNTDSALRATAKAKLERIDASIQEDLEKAKTCLALARWDREEGPAVPGGSMVGRRLGGLGVLGNAAFAPFVAVKAEMGE